MSQYQIARFAALIGILWVIGQGIFQIAVADAPIPAFYWLNAANMLQAIAVLLAVALLLVTNTRRPKGIDPDMSPVSSAPPTLADTDQRALATYDAPGRSYGQPSGNPNPDQVALIIAALRELPPEARQSMLGLGVVTDPAALRASDSAESADGEPTERPAWVKAMLQGYEDQQTPTPLSGSR